jgi:hypothetical protein
MQWQSIAEGKAKDTWERSGCGAASAHSAPARTSAPALATLPAAYAGSGHSQILPPGTGAALLATGGPATELHAQEPGQSLMTAALRAHVTALEQDLARLQRDYQLLVRTCTSQPTAP